MCSVIVLSSIELCLHIPTPDKAAALCWVPKSMLLYWQSCSTCAKTLGRWLRGKCRSSCNCHRQSNCSYTCKFSCKLSKQQKLYIKLHSGGFLARLLSADCPDRHPIQSCKPKLSKADLLLREYPRSTVCGPHVKAVCMLHSLLPYHIKRRAFLFSVCVLPARHTP